MREGTRIMKKLFYGGKIYTMDEGNTQVEAVCVEDGRILATGTLEEMRTVAGDDADEVDLQGSVMLPGLIEPHAHLDLAAFIHPFPFIGGLKYDSAEDVIDQMKRAAAETPAGKWIFCFGLDYLINRDLPEIDRYWLDEITTDHPMIVLV